MTAPIFAPGQLKRRVATRVRAVTLPDPSSPYLEAPPMLLTEPTEFADVAPIGDAADPPQQARGTGQRQAQDLQQTIADFMAWRARWERKQGRRSTPLAQR
jgi:hypothetical protein